MIPLTPRRLFSLLFCLVCALRAPADALPPGEPLLEPDDFDTKSAPEMIVLRKDAATWRGESVWRAASTLEASEPWFAQIKARVERGVKKGDTALLVVQARAVETSHESDQAQLRLIVSEDAKPFPRVATGHYFADREWRQFALPFTFAKDFGPGELTVMLDLGFGRQTVELAGLRVINFGASVPLASLPRTRPSYLGHAPDSAWRREALERIERVRKGELAVSLVDVAGRPVPGAEVRAVLRSHAFQFGTAVNVDSFTLLKSPDRETYRRIVEELFNAASLENALKWSNWAGEKKPADYRLRTMETLDWLRERDFAIRGHVMVWPGRRFLPDKILAALDGPERDRVPGMVLEHIRDIGAATKDHVSEWDVLNEPVNNHDLMDAFGRGVMVDWFKEAARVRPGVPLYLNDWGNHDQRQSPAHVRDFEAVARYLLDEGAPLGGLGLQCHVGGVLSAPADILATLDRYEKTFGLPVRATEFDVTVDDEEIQADYTRDFLIAMFSHPSVVGVQFWGFWAGRHWQPKAALYRQDWTEKPAGAAYRKLVKETWHTDASGRTDAAGAWSARAFHGTYELTVQVGDHVQRMTLRHEPGATGVHRIALPATR